MFRMILQVTAKQEYIGAKYVKYWKLYIIIWQKLFITITITNHNMNSNIIYILDILNAASTQISIWRWEMHMITKYGLNWGYKESWERF